MKFGGTSVGKPERMQQVANLVTQPNEPVIVVLSALSGTTNSLVKIGNALAETDRVLAKNEIDQLEKHYKDFIKSLVKTPAALEQASKIVEEHFEFLNIILKISYSESLSKDILAQGELLSTKLFSVYLTENGISHQYLPALEFMSIDQNDEPHVETIAQKLKPILEKHSSAKLFVTQGYICKNSRGEVDNLKRGGSDYTASLIAAAVNASVCEIWTDIDGMHNNDPRIVNKTIPIEQLSFDEAAELAYFGAKILHPTCIWPAKQTGVPVKLLNTMQPQAKGTTITKEAALNGVKAIAAKDDIIAINIKSSRMLLAYGFLRKIFEVFEKYKTPIDMITTSEVAVSVTIDQNEHLKDIVRELEPFGVISVTKNQTIISVVGNKMASNTEVLDNLFHALNKINISMISYGGSEHNISLLVPSEYKIETLKILNKALFGLD